MRKFFLIAGLAVGFLKGFSQVPRLDSAFGTFGRISTSIGVRDDFAKAMAVQRDGKIVLAGHVLTFADDGDFAIVRYNTNGTLDTSFGGTGKLKTAIGSFDDRATAIAIQRDGRIVVAGYSRGISGGYRDFALARYNINGSLDTSFDGDGSLTTTISPLHDEINAIAIQNDGKIVVTGISYVNNYPVFALARYNANGSLDSSFDGDGILTTSASLFNKANAIAIQTDGKIVIGGYTGNGTTSQFAMARYYPDGKLDVGFDGDGKVITDVRIQRTSVINSLAIQTDGKIVAAGYAFTGTGADADFVVARYNIDGSRDISFDGDGIAITPIASGGGGYIDDIATAVGIQTNEKIVAGGYSITGDNMDFALVRYNRNGSLDSTFNGNGKASFDLFGKVDYATCVALSSNRIYLAGYKAALPWSYPDFAIASFINDSYYLPFRLVDFSGRQINNNAFLKWKTENELDTYQFILERSTDDLNYTTLATVASINMTGIYNRQFEDPAFHVSGASRIYYRLSVKDINGQIVESRVISFLFDKNTNSVLFYPNPAGNEANIIISVDKADQVRLRVIDNLGRIHQQQQLNLQQGATSMAIDVRKLAKGVYVLDLKGKHINKQIKFIK